MNFKKSEILEISRRFFSEIVLPILEKDFPEIVRNSACGFFGYGSECLGMDDHYSQDHHFGLRINMLVPNHMMDQTAQRLVATSNRFSSS